MMKKKKSSNETEEMLEIEVLKNLSIIERILFKKKFIQIYKAGVKSGFGWEIK